MKSFLLSFTAIFVALDIIGTVPMYLGLTQSLSTKVRYRIVNKSILVAFVVALLFMFGGLALFRHLGISLFDFKIAGGLVLLLISLADLVGGPETTTQNSGETGVVPLAVPLITGPGLLTTLILQVGAVGPLITLAALGSNFLMAWLILRHCDAVTRWIGKDGTIVVSKIAALLLAAIAVAMMRSGIFEAVREFSGR